MSSKISVLVPVYNSEAFLPQSVGSLLAQTYTNIEIILVNDGSPDDSASICDAFAQRDDRIKVLHQDNQGAAQALNNGMALATGDYLMFLDADDWIEPNTCQVALDAANQSGADMVFWSFVKEYKDKSIAHPKPFPEECIFENDQMIFLQRRMIGLVGAELVNPVSTDTFNAGWGKLYRRTLFDQGIRWTDTKIVGSSDVLFNIQLSWHIKKAHYLPLYLMHYHQSNPHSLTKNYNLSLFDKYLSLFKGIQTEIDRHHGPEVFQQALNNRIALSTINNALSIAGANGVTHPKRIAHFRKILCHPVYRNALSQLPLHYLPTHWKVFFYCCKKGWACPVYLLAMLMKKLR